MSITRFLHTGMEVADLDAAIALYESVGFEVTKRFHKPEPDAEAAFVTKGETELELWYFNDFDHPLVEYIRSHLAFYSDDLETDVAKFVANGYELVIPITNGMVLRYAYVRDARGTCIELATELK